MTDNHDNSVASNLEEWGMGVAGGHKATPLMTKLSWVEATGRMTARLCPPLLQPTGPLGTEEPD